MLACKEGRISCGLRSRRQDMAQRGVHSGKGARLANVLSYEKSILDGEKVRLLGCTSAILPSFLSRNILVQRSSIPTRRKERERFPRSFKRHP